MTKPNFAQMSRKELRSYLLENRDDEAAFEAYMDKLSTEPVLAHGTIEDAQDQVRFAAIFEKLQKIKHQFEK